MLFEAYDLGVEPRTAQVIAGLLLGLLFGAAAQVSRFCLRRAVAGPAEERASAAAVWLSALATAVIGFAIAAKTGWVHVSDHRLVSADLPVVAIIVGGLLFGAGMVLTRGCVSRLTVLSATGNLRAATVLIVFAITAHATLKGVLAPLRTALGDVTIASPIGSLAETGFGAPLLAAVILALVGFLAARARPRLLHLAFGALIGMVAVGGWMTTSVLLFDEFDPLPVQSAAFTLPWSDTLFWTIASSAVPAGFGVGLMGGVLGGSFLAAVARGELRLQSFETAAQTLRYGAGGMMMGIGGVLAGGCTVGAGLSGVATGSVAALLALFAIALGGWIAGNVTSVRSVGSTASA